VVLEVMSVFSTSPAGSLTPPEIDKYPVRKSAIAADAKPITATPTTPQTRKLRIVTSLLPNVGHRRRLDRRNRDRRRSVEAMS
jgi:hypothetical protein